MKKGSTVIQFLAAAAGSLSASSAGVLVSWIGLILLKLEKGDGPLRTPINSDESSWIASLTCFGAVPGSFIAGYCGDRLGRKPALLASVVPLLIGWTLVGTATHVIQFYFVGLIFGIAVAFPFTVLPMYYGEIAETPVRGALGSFLQFFTVIGILYSYVIGSFVSYTIYYIVCAILPVIFFVCFVMMPESPYYLLSKGRRNEAIASLAKLRCKSKAAVQQEIEEIQIILDGAFKKRIFITDLIKVKANLKALSYICIMLFFQTFTGINVVLLYMPKIFVAAGGSVSTEIGAIIIAVMQLIASAVTPMLIDKLGRKILLVFSGIGEVVSLCALGLYFYLKEMQYDDNIVAKISWLPVFTLIIFIVSYNMGWGSVPWAMMSEMFASNIKAKASALMSSFCWFLAFLIVKFSNNMKEAFGNYAIFWTFGGFSVASIIFVILVLPETKGKSLQQIQDELNGVNTIINVKDEILIEDS